MMDWVIIILYVIGGAIGLVVSIFVFLILRVIILWIIGVGDITTELVNLNRNLAELVNLNRKPAELVNVNSNLARLLDEVRETKQLMYEINEKLESNDKNCGE
jgi:hypothetical protein